MNQQNVLILDNIGNIIGNTSFQAPTLPTVVITTDGYTRAFQRTEDKNNIPAYLEVSCVFSAAGVQAAHEEPQPGETKDPVDAMVNEGGLTHD